MVYRLSFAFAARPNGSPANRLGVYWDGQLVADLDDSNLPGGTLPGGWRSFQLDLLATGTTTELRFVDLAFPDSYGTLLDDVEVVAIAQQSTLCAAQEIPAGTVVVSNDDDELFVTFLADPGYALAETHLAVATDPGSLPQNRSGNPQIGRFPYAAEHDPPVASFTYTIPLAGFGGVSPLYVAAHAVVLDVANPGQLTVLSDTQALVTRDRPGNAAFAFGDPVAALDPPPPAVAAWVHPAWVGPSSGLRALGATWIWETHRAQYPVLGKVIRLERSFAVPGFPLGGSLRVTCDNAYQASLNGAPLGAAQVPGSPGAGAGVCPVAPWQDSDLREACVSTSDWQSIESWPLTGKLVSGANLLAVDAGNERFQGGEEGHGSDGTIDSNPAGCIFVLDAEYARDETAWGAACPDDAGIAFPGASWASYFTYELQ